MVPHLRPPPRHPLPGGAWNMYHLSNWSFYGEAVHFLGPKRVIFCNFTLRFQGMSPKLWIFSHRYVCSAKSPLMAPVSCMYHPPRGRVKMEPFVLLAFFPCFVVIFGQFEPIPVTRPSVILLDFPCFIGISAVFGLWKPNSPFVLVDPQNGPFYTPKTLRFKGEMPKSDATTTLKLGEKTPKGQMVPFSIVKPAKLDRKMQWNRGKTPKGQIVPFSRMYPPPRPPGVATPFVSVEK